MVAPSNAFFYAPSEAAVPIPRISKWNVPYANMCVREQAFAFTPRCCVQTKKKTAKAEVYYHSTLQRPSQCPLALMPAICCRERGPRGSQDISQVNVNPVIYGAQGPLLIHQQPLARRLIQGISQEPKGLTQTLEDPPPPPQAIHQPKISIYISQRI